MADIDESEFAADADLIVDKEFRTPEVIHIPGDRALSLDEADEVAASRSSRVVLVAGEAEAGKTTLIVEIFAQFLGGPFSEWSFAGSRTLKALDDRHRSARVSSGAAKATTDRTQDEGMRLLHLELGRLEERVNLLISDLSGELFEAVGNGSPVGVEVPLASRADICVVLIDGARLHDPPARASALFRARQLVGGLTDAGGLRAGTPVVIVCSKSDLLTKKDRRAVDPAMKVIADLARARGAVVETLHLSARPEDTNKDPSGLDSLLEMLARDEPSATRVALLENDAEDRFVLRRNGGV